LLQLSARHLILTLNGMSLPVENMVSIPAANNSMTALNMLGPDSHLLLVHQHANRDCTPTQNPNECNGYSAKRERVSSMLNMLRATVTNFLPPFAISGLKASWASGLRPLINRVRQRPRSKSKIRNRRLQHAR